MNRCRLTPRFLSHRVGYRSALLQVESLQVARPLSISPELLARIVECPPFADSISEGDISWMKEVGDSVSLDETVGEVETDKTSLPVNAPAAGTVTKLLVEDGETVTPGTPLFEMEEGAGGAAPAAPAAKAAAPAEPAAPAAAAPVAAAAAPIPTEAPKAAPVPSKPMSSSKTDFTAPAPAVLGSAGPSREERRVKMTRMRTRIAQRLKDAQNTCAMLTTFNELDMSGILQMRKEYKDLFEKSHDQKLGFMSAFIKAAATGLVQEPAVNAVIDDATNEIIFRDFVDVSFAAATPKGLVVPVIRNVESMSILDIERELARLAGLARAGALSVEDMEGGTFTISNGGVFGSLFGTPIINPPQSAILGMHGTFERPVAINGKVEIRPMMYVALTYDHRLIDGREAVTFLKGIKQKVEDPRRLLLDL
jgi:2-oxoglutarate dehydrogenase E2 component (dihydrolipoamide succinyltransferase)